MLRHAVAVFFWVSALFIFVVSLRGEILSERKRKNGQRS